ncbi:hypothetical protein SAMN06265173_107121 [Thalassovita litoralis]|jgi:hypothetical protein|uniref:Aspartate carbamoyltransferase catalytic subunit n=1 Tax=Thalassovita litoralis TaxID=1010611 RepID=A0A521CSQ8_9RHOB|nr:aspartate carbamoyltransferase catalytic subunit [Thalassovita litoralis]SMO62462.1 hypothetical protein SAMN06265173_107121 [Thalassovita litoralis]
MTTAQGWEDILDQDEQILWQGRPDGAVVISPLSLLPALFGLFFAGFALFWMIMASKAGGIFWMFGLIHFSVGLGLAFGAVFGKPYKYRHTWYTLTNKRAFIATDLPFRGKRLKSYAIDSTSPLSMEDEGRFAAVQFATETYRTKNRTRTRRVGFDRITDGHHVYRLMRDIRSSDQPGPQS